MKKSALIICIMCINISASDKQSTSPKNPPKSTPNIEAQLPYTVGHVAILEEKTQKPSTTITENTELNALLALQTLPHAKKK